MRRFRRAFALTVSSPFVVIVISNNNNNIVLIIINNNNNNNNNNVSTNNNITTNNNSNNNIIIINNSSCSNNNNNNNNNILPPGERNARPGLQWLAQCGTGDDTNQSFEKEMQKRIKGYGTNKNMVLWCVFVCLLL